MYKIAIDGPGGAGKSSVAKALAQILNITYVDTGALYRTIGLYVKNHGANPKSVDEVVPLLSQISIELKYVDGKQVILLNGVDVGDSIRTPEISMYASDVSALPPVRQFLLDTQRNIAKKTSIIMDGRDIGTVIFPDAEVKIFLTATPENRAERRYLELKAKGQDVSYEKILEETNIRDYNDSHREIAPLKPAEDAIIFDNTGFVVQQSVDGIFQIIKEKLKDQIHE